MIVTFSIGGRTRILMVVALVCCSHAFAGEEFPKPLESTEVVGIRAPEGFEVSLFAGDELAHDIFSMTLDSEGNVVVAGPGYIKTLLDDDGDGRADRAILYASKPNSGAHGLLFEGTQLFATGDNGIWRFSDANNDHVADSEPVEVVAGLSHKEHGANGLARGPDGWLYVICGNDAGVSERFASSSRSPVQKPNCGSVLRFSPGGRESEIVADGFRNPYDLCFHPSGNLFTVDADGERDHHLPWYAPSRLFDVASGMHHGWVIPGWQWSWNRPASYFDNVERCAEIGRGSPTGIVCYQHRQFPARYRNGIFTACWTLGRVYYCPLAARGGTFDGQVETFLETTGEFGFAPVDIAVGPDGDLFVAIGGRGTRGSVFRVRYTGDEVEPLKEAESVIERVLAAPQPLEAWSRANWLPAAKRISKADWEAGSLNAANPAAWRVRALEIIGELYDRPTNECLTHLADDENANVVAASLRSIQHAQSEDCVAYLAKGTFHESPVVQRQAWEILATRTPPQNEMLPALHWKNISADRRVHAAAVRALARGWLPNDSAHDDQSVALDDQLWAKHFAGQPLTSEAIDWHALFEDSRQHLVADVFLSRLRLLVIAHGDVNVDPSRPNAPPGYSLTRSVSLPEDAANVLRKMFPTGHIEADRELARCYALFAIGDGPLREDVANRFTTDTSPVDDIHYLMCLARLPGKNNVAARSAIATAIARLDRKMKSRKWYPSRNWPDRVSETFSALAANDGKLAGMVVENDSFYAASQAFLFVHLAADLQQQAARRLLREVATFYDDDARWSTDLITLVGSLPFAEASPTLRGAWDDYALRDAILPVLAKHAGEADRGLFVEALDSVQPGVVSLAAEAMSRLKNEPSDEEWLAVFRALRQACLSLPANSTRTALLNLVQQWSGKSFAVKEVKDEMLASYAPAFDWFNQSHPRLASKLKSAAASSELFNQLLTEVDWEKGDRDRGKVVFNKRSCVKCHAGASPFGPDLAGVAGRLSRADLFAAIVEPSRDVAPAYQATQIATASGKVYQGIVTYESPDGTLLSTGPVITIRIAGDEIVSLQKSRLSIMPTGLLNDATADDLADLYAYLKSLAGKR